MDQQQKTVFGPRSNNSVRSRKHRFWGVKGPKSIRKVSLKYPESTQRSPRQASGKYPESIRKVSGKYPESIRKLSGKYPESIRKVSGKYPGICLRPGRMRYLHTAGLGVTRLEAGQSSSSLACAPSASETCSSLRGVGPVLSLIHI